MSEIDDAKQQFWNSLSNETKQELFDICRMYDSAEEMYRDIFIGACPQCGSSKTIDCDEIEGIQDITVGFCLNCRHFWCVECGSPLSSNIVCEHWMICDSCEKYVEDEGCGILIEECECIRNWLRMKTDSLS